MPMSNHHDLSWLRPCQESWLRYFVANEGAAGKRPVQKTKDQLKLKAEVGSNCLGARPIDPKLLHAAAQSVGMKSENLRGTKFTLDDP